MDFFTKHRECVIGCISRDDAAGKFVAYARNNMAALIAELRQLREQTQWQPIETCPPFATKVWLYGPNTPCRYYSAHPGNLPALTFTHWMPLAAPPETARQAAHHMHVDTD